ncbi:MAG: outer membrane protein transport protein [bacterium]
MKQAHGTVLSVRRVARGLAAAFVALLAPVASEVACAGDFNYADVFPGDRAASMGGAYTAISNDASGTYYNPAGLVHAPHASVSVSANAFAWRSQTYRSAFFGEDVDFESSTFFPSAVASALKPTSMPGLALGFSVIVPHASTSSSKQLFHPQLYEGIDTHIGSDFEVALTTYELGPSVAYELTPSLSVGATLYAVYATSSTRIGFTTQQALVGPEGVPLVTDFRFQSVEDSSLGFVSVLGALWSPVASVDLALAIRPPGYQSHDVTSRITVLALSNDGVLVPNPGLGEARDSSFDEGQPASFTPAIAWRPWDRLTLAAEASLFLRRSFDVAGVSVARELTWNANVGAEYRLADEVPVRLGFFTNRTSSPAPKPGDTRYLDHVSDYGFTVGTAYVVSYAELSVGLRMSWGEGKSVSLTDVSQVSDVDANETVLFIGSGYQF